MIINYQQLEHLLNINLSLLSSMVSTSPTANRHRGHKYSKVTQQKKFHLLNLIFKEHHSIRTAAAIAGIKFLTAKTILFFYENNCKSYRFDIERQDDVGQGRFITAVFSTIKRLTDINDKLIKPKSRIEVICSIGNVLSPPKAERVNSLTTCYKHQDVFFRNAPSLCLDKHEQENGNFLRINGERLSVSCFKQMSERSYSSLLEVKAAQVQGYNCSWPNIGLQ